MRLKFLAAAAVIAAGVASTGTANATLISIGLQEAGVNSSNITTVATDSGSGNAAIGGLTYGTFSVNNISGTGSPILPQPTLDSSSLNVSSTSSGTLYVFITQQGLTSPTGINNFLSTFTINAFIGSVVSVTEKTLISSMNVLYGGTTLATLTDTTGVLATLASTNPSPSLSTFSETEEYIITATGTGTANDTIQMQAVVPEPVSLSLMGVGLIGLGMVRRRRRS